MVVMLKQCCCGCTPRTGALIIAVVFAIVSALLVVMFSLGAVVSAEQYALLVEERQERQRDTHHITTTTTTTTTTTPDPDDDLDDYTEVQHLTLDARITVLMFWKCLTVLITLTESLDFLLSVLLMFAADKNSARHVRLWLLGFCAVSGCRTLMLAILSGVIFYAKPVSLAVFVLAVFTTLTAGTGYSILVVFSFYRQLVGTSVLRRISQQDD